MQKLILLILLTSCAKVSYMAEQGIGQVALEWNGKKNEKVLADTQVKEEHKRKIKLVIKAKEYFFKYFALESNSIYDQTTFLEQEAVSYLVIHAPDNKVKALKSCFIIAGCFPYQGFFKKKSAQKYKKEKEQLGFHTYMRPVYAYSTLNHPLIPFSDNILSSFFHFKDEQLIHLIFHELVHTVVFVKDEAEFNENLAQFIADSMMNEYLGLEEDYLVTKQKNKEKMESLRIFIVNSSKQLSDLYRHQKNNSKHILRNFIQNHFNPGIENLCKENNLKKCWPLNQSWNNARFAAFNTYERKRSELQNIYKRSDKSLKHFLARIIELEDKFDHDTSFFDYIVKERI